MNAEKVRAFPSRPRPDNNGILITINIETEALNAKALIVHERLAAIDGVRAMRVD